MYAVQNSVIVFMSQSLNHTFNNTDSFRNQTADWLNFDLTHCHTTLDNSAFKQQK